jgi:hypothetical protein
MPRWPKILGKIQDIHHDYDRYIDLDRVTSVYKNTTKSCGLRNFCSYLYVYKKFKFWADGQEKGPIIY